jgi:hypothetical protein
MLLEYVVVIVLKMPILTESVTMLTIVLTLQETVVE